MSRAALALVLLVAPLLAAPLADAQAPGTPLGYVIPTQQEAQVGGLNVTVWVMRDTRSLSYTPDVRQNPLNYLWNLNFTAGSSGVFYVNAEARAPGAYAFEARLHASSPLLQVTGAPTPGDTAAQACVARAALVRCNLTAERSSANHPFQFAIAGSAEPGTMTVGVEVLSFVGDSAEPEARQNLTYELAILDPIPPFAVRTMAGNATTLAAWVNGGPVAFGGQGCLAGASLGGNDSIVVGTPAAVCLLAVSRSAEEVRLVANVAGPEWLIVPPTNWTSQPFDATTGGAAMPVNGFSVRTSGVAPLGVHQLRVVYTLERNVSGAWTPAESGELLVPFTVVAPTVVVRGPAQINWFAHAPLLLAAVAGLGYLAAKNRRPKIQPRSQAMRSELARKTGRRRAEESVGASATSASVAEQVQATPEEIAQQRQVVQEAAWDKKRKILEAKREDILKSIRIAEERHQRGEITEHVLKGIRERKERQLEQVQAELEQLQE